MATGVESWTYFRVLHERNICFQSIPELVDSDVWFIDTPGFDDTNKSEDDVFDMIAEWLNDTYVSSVTVLNCTDFYN